MPQTNLMTTYKEFCGFILSKGMFIISQSPYSTFNINIIAGSRYYFTWIQLPEHYAVFSFSCKHLIPYVNGKTIVPINITNKISKSILIVVFWKCLRGIDHCSRKSQKQRLFNLVLRNKNVSFHHPTFVTVWVESCYTIELIFCLIIIQCMTT